MPTTHLEARAMVARQRVQACLFAHVAATVPEQKRAVEEDIARLLGGVLAGVADAQYAEVRRVFAASPLQVPIGQTPQKTAQSCSGIQKALGKEPRLVELYQLAASHLALVSPPPAAPVAPAAAPTATPTAATPRSFEIALPSARECFGVTRRYIFVAAQSGVQTIGAATGSVLATTALPFTPSRVAAGGGTVAFFDSKTLKIATMRLGPDGLQASSLVVGNCFMQALHLSCWGDTVAVAAGQKVQVYSPQSGHLRYKFEIFAHKKGVHAMAMGEKEILTFTEGGDHMRFWSTQSRPRHALWCTDVGVREMRMSATSIAAHGRDFYVQARYELFKIAEDSGKSSYTRDSTSSIWQSRIAASEGTLVMTTDGKVMRWNRGILAESPKQISIPDKVVDNLCCIAGGFVTRVANEAKLRVHRF